MTLPFRRVFSGGLKGSVCALSLLGLLMGAGFAHAQLESPSTQEAVEEPGGPVDYPSAFRRMAEKLEGQFPAVDGFVASIRGEDIYLTLGEASHLRSGTELSVYRELGSFKHPVTGQVLGSFEEELGVLVIQEVREQFSVARLKTPSEFEIQEGDRVRITSAKVRLAVLPFENQTGQRLNLDTLTFGLASAVAGVGRFEVFDADKLQVWLLEMRVSVAETTSPENLPRLQQFVRADFLLKNTVRLVQDRQVIESQLVDAEDGRLGETQLAVVRDLPQVASAPAARTFPIPRQGEGAVAPDHSEVNPNFVLRKDVPESRGVNRSQTFKWVASGMTTGDFDGDGRVEVAFIYDNRLSIYRWEGGRLIEEFLYKGGLADRFLAVDSIDLDGSGVPEIYVTNRRHPNVLSFVLEHRNGKYEVIASRLSVFFRAIEPVGRPPMLIGQREGVARAFHGDVYRYGWEGDKLVAKESLQLPKGGEVYGFNLWDVDQDGIEEVVEVTRNENLTIARRNGEQIWRGGDRIGVSLVEFRHDPTLSRPEEPSGLDSDVRPVYLPIRGRLLLRDLNGSGRPSLLVPVNLRRLEFVSSSGYKDAELVAMAWDGQGLSEQWRSRKVGGIIADYAFGDLDGDGAEELILAVITKDLLSLSEGVSRAVVYSLGQ